MIFYSRFQNIRKKTVFWVLFLRIFMKLTIYFGFYIATFFVFLPSLYCIGLRDLWPRNKINHHDKPNLIILY